MVKRAPELIHPGVSAVSTVRYDPDGLFGPLFGWETTLPDSDHERFEWSNCADCPFEVVQVVSEVPPDYPGFLEVWQQLPTISAIYRWRVVATYGDGSELASETGTYTVYAFIPVTISGTVADALSGDAVGGTHLTLESGPATWTRRTDAGGTFSFIDGPGGPEQPILTVSKDGYATLTIALNVGESIVLDLELSPEP
jgi:hypothetical protein